MTSRRLLNSEIIMLKQFLIIFSICLVVSALLFYLFQRNLIYFPVKEKPNLDGFGASDMSEVTINTKDNVNLTSWYKPAKNNQPTILFLHGNAGHIGYRMPWIRRFLNDGYGVFILEYRGYGGNEGSPSEEGLYEDGRTALRYLYSRAIRPNKVVLYGESLGTAVATQLATESEVCAVILQSPFTSMSRMARHHYPWIFLKPWDKFDSLRKINKISVPLLIAHGYKDKVVPFSEGELIFNQANEPKKMIRFDKGHHNNLWGDYFYREINNFININCTGSKLRGSDPAM
jgi:uncharacterized protein